MKKEFNHNFYGAILILGGIVYLATNLFWSLIPNVKFGEWLYFFGEFWGMSSFLLICRQYFKNKSQNLFLIGDFFWNLSLTKLFTQCFLNPLEFQVSEFWGLGICFVILLIRIIKKN